LNNPVKNNPA